MKLILVFPLYFEQMEMLPMMGDYTVTTVNDHMVILCQHYMGAESRAESSLKNFEWFSYWYKKIGSQVRKSLDFFRSWSVLLFSTDFGKWIPVSGFSGL